MIEHFLNIYNERHERSIETLTQKAVSKLMHHRFPGNVRELENCIESAVVLSRGSVIDAEDIRLAPRKSPRLIDADLSKTLGEMESDYIRRVIDDCGGNQSEAARRLGIHRNTLAAKLQAA